jgi:hypothetical protein
LVLAILGGGGTIAYAQGQSVPDRAASCRNERNSKLERLFLEERRRTQIITNGFGERPVLKLMYAATIRAAESLGGLAVGEFERRQLPAPDLPDCRIVPSSPRCAGSDTDARRHKISHW